MSIIDIRNEGRGGENKRRDNSPNLITKLIRGYYCTVSLGSGENKIKWNLQSFYPYVFRLVDHSLPAALVDPSLSLIDTKRPINQLLMLFAPQIRFQNPVSSQLEQEANIYRISSENFHQVNPLMTTN